MIYTETSHIHDMPPIILFEESSAAAARQNPDTKIIELKLNFAGTTTDTYYIAVRDSDATLADIVPMARSLSTKIGQAVLRNLSSRGLPIPCSKACSAACCYHPIPLSVPEVLCLVEEVKMMPAQQHQDFVQSCRKIAERIRQLLPEYFVSHKSINVNNIKSSQFDELSDWYNSLEQPCPFLRDNLCTIYEQRPAICRDWFVTGSSNQCRVGGSHKVRALKMPIYLTGVLVQLTNELENTNQDTVLLPFVFDWYLQNAERHQRTYPAISLVELSIDILLQRSNEQNSKLQKVMM